MDTLFRLVSLQSSSSDQQHHHHQQSNSSFNSTTTSRSSSKHQNHNNNYNYQQQQQQQQQQYSYNSDSSYYPQQQQYSYNSDSSYYPQQQQHQAYSSSYQYYYPRNSSSSSPQEEEDPAEECCNNPHPTTTPPPLYMDEDHFSSSSSSSKAHHFLTTPPSSSSNPNPHPSSLVFDPPPTDLSAGGARWGTDLLLDCARAVSVRDTPRVQQLMWMMNELASPYGDKEQKLASYFLQALFARLTSSGPRTLRTLSSASDRTASFDSTRRTALRFQDLSPWSSFGHVAANGAILESFLLDSTGAPQRLHILDLSNTFCTQWPTLLEALATRSADDTPHLTITTVVSSPAASSAVQRVMKEIGARMEKFARLMGVPFKFHIVHHAGDLSTLDLDRLGCSDDGDAAALAINCVNSLHSVSPAGRRRDGFISTLRRLRPRIVTVVEEEADLDVGGDGGDDEEGFLKGFRESMKFFSAYFDSLEESFPKTSNERLALERAAGRAVVDLVACPAAESMERRETAAGWSRRLRSAGLTPASFSDDVADDVRALLRRYREGWSMTAAAAGDEAAAAAATAGIFLAWKEQPVVWASAWRM